MKIFEDGAILARVIENIKKEPIQYYIGVDAYSSDTESSYALGYRTDDNFVVLLAKTERNKDTFMEEVNNLVKYFNAVKIEENGETKRKNRIKR